MAKSIFDLVTADQIVSYWNTIQADQTNYIGEELFPAQKKTLELQ